MPNAAEGIRKLVARLRREAVERVVIEAIGPYARAVIQALDAAGLTVGVVNPRRIKGYREAEGKRAKHRQAGRRADCALRSQYARTAPPAAWCRGTALKATLPPAEGSWSR